MARSQAKLDERSRIRQALGLPSIVRLVAGHGILGGLVPFAAWFAAHVLLANERFLDIVGPGIVDRLLAMVAARFQTSQKLAAVR